MDSVPQPPGVMFYSFTNKEIVMAADVLYNPNLMAFSTMGCNKVPADTNLGFLPQFHFHI
jgi:hypothetical protein